MKRANFPSILNPESVEESPAPAAESGRELQELISPISCEEFAKSYFSRAPLSVQGTPEKFDHIFSWEKLKQALARGQHITDKRYNIMASFTGGEESGTSRRMFEVYYDQLDELLRAGATICITNLHMADPILGQWARAIRTQLNFTGTVGINCYISPDGSGLPTHYDKRVATSLQIAGNKRWRFSTEPAKAWPTQNALYQPEDSEIGATQGKLPPDMEFREVELTPGDLLCIPAGAWHSARAVGNSLALNLYFSPRNFLDQLIPLFQEFAAASENWRGGPPVTMEKIQGGIPQTTAAYIRERLDEFYKFAFQIANGPDELVESWLSSLTYSPQTGWQPVPKSSPQQVTAEQRFRVVTSSLRFVQFQGKATLTCDHGIFRFPPTAAPILQRLSSESGSFTLDDILTWRAHPDKPSPNEVMSCLQTLSDNEIIEIVE